MELFFPIFLYGKKLSIELRFQVSHWIDKTAKIKLPIVLRKKSRDNK